MFNCSSLLAMDHYHGNPSPANINPHINESFDPRAEFELSDYLMLDDGFRDDSSSTQSMVSPEHAISGGSAGNNAATSRNNINNKRKTGLKKSKMEVTHRVAFRTKSELEVMDDGFKWRKYGKKSVKNSPNPRNYYKCSSEGCSVKKRVERDRDDREYVITMYEGVHNHESPFVAYYDHMSSAVAPDDCWTTTLLQDSSSQVSFPS